VTGTGTEASVVAWAPEEPQKQVLVYDGSMFLVVGGVYVIGWSLVQALKDTPDSFAFPVWFRVLAIVLPLITLPRWHGRMRLGIVALALVGLGVHSPAWCGHATAQLLVIFGSAVMVWAGWTSLSAARRLAEVKEMLPWLVAFAIVLLGLRVGSLLLSNG